MSWCQQHGQTLDGTAPIELQRKLQLAAIKTNEKKGFQNLSFLHFYFDFSGGMCFIILLKLQSVPAGPSKAWTNFCKFLFLLEEIHWLWKHALEIFKLRQAATT